MSTTKEVETTEKATGFSFDIAQVIDNITSKHLSTQNSAKPILSKSRSSAHKIDQARKEYKVKKELIRLRKEKLRKDHVDVDQWDKKSERRYRKNATKGVVQLLNTIQQYKMNGARPASNSNILQHLLDKVHSHSAQDNGHGREPPKKKQKKSWNALNEKTDLFSDLME
ncbi:hypothetical protein PCE1_004422 [Barthelona sp. PCE]